MKVFKYFVDTPDGLVPMKHGAKVLSVQMQAGRMCAWALVDESRCLITREFAIVGTGHELPPDKEWGFLATVLDGFFVWHVFERLDNRAG